MSTARQPWLNRSSPAPRPWPDCSVRRVFSARFPLAHAAVINLMRTLPATSAGHHGIAVVVHGDAPQLVCTPLDAERCGEEWRAPGALHLHRFGRPMPVELVLAAWSATRSELRLDLRTRRGGLRIPAGYFDVAHDVMDELLEAIEATIENSAPGRLSRAEGDHPLATVIPLAEARARLTGDRRYPRRGR